MADDPEKKPLGEEKEKENSALHLFFKNLPEKKKSELKVPVSDAEVLEMFQKMKKWDEDLKKQLNDLYEKGRMYNIDVEKMLNSPAYFSQDQWDFIHRNKDLFVSQVESVLTGAGGKKRAKTTDELTKTRRGKTLGARRNWMPMK